MPATSPPASRWAAFTATPHRVLFLAGAVQFVATLLFWLCELLLRQAGHSLPTTVPTTWMHALLMLYGLFPFFIFGFLLTVYPRWMNAGEITRERYLPVFGWLAAGQALVWLGLFASRTLLELGIVVMLAGWARGIAVLFSVYFTTRPGNKQHETVLNAALIAGACGLAGYLLWLLSGDPAYLWFAVRGGLWFFLLPVFFTVAHRMIPFFGACALPGYPMLRPARHLLLWVGCAVIHGVLELDHRDAWTWLVDAPLAASALWHSALWQPRRVLPIRLLAVLHIAFAWFGIGMALYALHSLSLLAGGGGLGRAPLHALALGFMSGLLVAMATRVTLGHSGSPLQADRYTWWCFLALNAATLIRILADWPGVAAFNPLAAALALTAAGAWVLRYLPVYLRPRRDGQPG